jgi:hypothetical protein
MSKSYTITKSMLDFLKGILLLVGICLMIWLVLELSEKVCLDGGTYCQQKFCGDPDKIKACEQESIERWQNASPEEKDKVRKLRDLLKDK